jgi:glucose/arabinose dehydrogenase
VEGTLRIYAIALAVILASCDADGSDVSDASAPTPAPVNTRPNTTIASADVPPATDAVDPTPVTSDAAPADPTNSDPTTTAATTSTSTSTTTTTVPPDPPPPNEQFDALSFDVESVADVRKPTAAAWRDGDEAMYVSTQPGPIFRVVDGVASVVIDLTSETFEDLAGSERGVLGVAFDPRDGRMFVNMTDLADDTRVISFELADGVAIADSRREVLFIDQPAVGHNGGRMLFDDDGHLFIGSGDGGGSNGRDAQDTTKLLGAILRITPDLNGDGYQIPEDNPFADGVADRPEIWARGFRNPWTFSLDDDTGDLWVGDVGNNSFEEISVMRGGESGLNFGWYYFEGNDQRFGNAPEGLIPPVYDYPRSDGVAVMAGHVYRGDAIAPLRGAYVFGDLTGPVWAIGEQGVSRLDVPRVSTLVGWAEDPDGELYLLGLNDGVFKLVIAS